MSLLFDLGLAEKPARRPAAVQRFEEAARLASDPLTRARAMLEEAEILFDACQWAQSLTLIDAAQTALGDREPALSLRAEGLRAWLTAYSEDYVDELVERLPRLYALAEGRDADARPLLMVMGCFAAWRGAASSEVRELVERGWGDGRYLAERHPIELVGEAGTSQRRSRGRGRRTPTAPTADLPVGSRSTHSNDPLT